MNRLFAITVAVVYLFCSSTTYAQSDQPIAAVLTATQKDAGLNPDLLDKLSDYLTVMLASAPGFRIMPRDTVVRLLVEKKASLCEDYFSVPCQKRMGKVLSADKLVTTEILKIGDVCVVGVTMFDLATETSEKAAPVHTGCTEDDFRKAVAEAASQISAGGTDGQGRTMEDGPVSFTEPDRTALADNQGRATVDTSRIYHEDFLDISPGGIPKGWRGCAGSCVRIVNNQKSLQSHVADRGNRLYIPIPALPTNFRLTVRFDYLYDEDLATGALGRYSDDGVIFQIGDLIARLGINRCSDYEWQCSQGTFVLLLDQRKYLEDEGGIRSRTLGGPFTFSIEKTDASLTAKIDGRQIMQIGHHGLSTDAENLILDFQDREFSITEIEITRL